MHIDCTKRCFVSWMEQRSHIGSSVTYRYLVTPDVAKYIGNPGLPMLFHRVEDRGIGTMLYGFNLTVVNGDKTFQPWYVAQKNTLPSI